MIRPSPCLTTNSAGRKAEIFSTYGWDRRRWRDCVDCLPPDASTAQRVEAIVRSAKRYPVIVLDGSERSDMIAAGLLSARRHRPRVLILDSTWKQGSSLGDRLATRAAVRTIDGDHVTYAVVSSYERDRFPHTWNVDPARVEFIPWHYDLSNEEMGQPVVSGRHFFSGGDSLRDYATLVAAASKVQEPVIIGTRAFPDRLADQRSPNVTCSRLSRSQYDELLRFSIAVVIALQAHDDRSSGQGTVLNAMAHGKTVIVNDAPGIADYVRPGETALVFPTGDSDALAESMRWVVQNPQAAALLGAQAQADVRARFGPDAYVDHVLALASRLAGGPR